MFTGTAITDQDGHFTYTSSTAFNADGLWTIRVRLAGNGNLNDSVATSWDLMVSAAAGYAILIQGDYSGTYADNYVASLDDIYQKLPKRAFKTENILYLGYGNSTRNPQITFTPTTKANIQDAITNWAAGRITAGGIAPLYIVLMDHGSPGQFHIDPDTITPEELDGWLTTLENKVQSSLGKQLTTIVVNGSCYSGGFIPKLSKPGRVIIASGAADEVTAQGPNTQSGKIYGEYFVYWLFNKLSSGKNLRDAFQDAAKTTQAYRSCFGAACGNNSLSGKGNTVQHPLLDDDGDGQGSWMDAVGQEDGGSASRILLGLGLNPVNLTFTEVLPTQTVMSGTASVVAYVKTNDSRNTAAAWVEIRKPSFVMPGQSGTGQVVMDYPKVLGVYNAASQRWEFDISSYLTEPGAYTLYYNAMDSEGEVISPVTGTLYVDTATNNPPSSFNLTNPDDNAEINDAMMIFRWETASDPDGDPVTYTVKIYEDNNGAKGNEIKRYELIPQEFYFINAIKEKRNDGVTTLFTTGGNYWWEVEAIDNKGKTTVSVPRKFHVLFTNAITGIITGIVSSDRDYARIVTATVTAMIGSQTFTLPVSNGAFAMAFSPGSLSLTSAAAGYQTASLSEVSSIAGDITVMNITMKPMGNLTVSLTRRRDRRCCQRPGRYTMRRFVSKSI